jgi:metal-dependent amidase/aminoacylase/carboxypeptidase family protein
MKQKIVTYLSTIKEEIFNLSKFLYDNPETSFSEEKACSYIVKMLKDHDFQVQEHYMQIPTAFYAQCGSGHPKICFLCEYDAMSNDGHIFGRNLVSAMSLAAGISLSNATKGIAGSIIILGCPGEDVGGAKVTMSKQGSFNDIDVVLMAHPDTMNYESGTSMAILPLSIIFRSKEATYSVKNDQYSALDACIFTYNTLNMLLKGFDEGCTIDNVLINGSSLSNSLSSFSELRLYIRAPKIKQAEKIEKRIIDFIKLIASTMEIQYETSIYELPYEELITNNVLSRIFEHNLKESGLINIEGVKNNTLGLSIGTVSHLIPCIHPYINIVEDTGVTFPSKEFAQASISQYALDKVIKAAQALAMTGLDLIEKEELLNEVKSDFKKQ